MTARIHASTPHHHVARSQRRQEASSTRHSADTKQVIAAHVGGAYRRSLWAELVGGACGRGVLTLLLIGERLP
jgi:hypothetical protein